MRTTTIGIVFKLITLSILCFCNIGIYALIISEIVDILIVVLLNYKETKKLLK